MLLALVLLTDVFAPQGGTREVSFDRDVRPLLAERCFACHGPDARSRKADLRLDTREGATRDLGGYAAVVPGDPARSELWIKINATSAKERMPPAAAHKPPLDAGERARIEAWIEAGAPWAKHWAFVPPIRPQLPDTELHPIDALVRRTLAAKGETPSPRAAVHTLAQRLSLDLTGLPPEPSTVAALGADPTDAAWRAWIDELLTSPAHAERLAMWWLDGARYADTDGFQQDETRSNWPWRDWVVDAFRSNLPFDRFTELQFAGDLRKGASAEEILATCFHRNHMHNGEGGRDPEESRVDYVRDRTNTTGTVWLGLTLECAQCHDHKFDPITQADYYALSAYFDSIDETGQAGGSAKPFLPYRSPLVQHACDLAEAEAAAAGARLTEIEAVHRPRFEQALAASCDRLVNAGADPHPVPRARVGWHAPIVTALASGDGGTLSITGAGRFARTGPATPKDEYRITLQPPAISRITGVELELFADQAGRFSDAADGEFILTGIKVSVSRTGDAADRGTTVHGRWRSGLANAVGRGVDAEVRSVRGALDDDPRKGWTTRGAELVGRPRAVFGLEEPLPVAASDRIEVKLLFRSNVDGAYARAGRVRVTGELGDAAHGLDPTPQVALREALRAGRSASTLDAALRQRLFEQFLDGIPQWREAAHRARRLGAQHERAKAAMQGVQVTVLRQRQTPRTTYVLERGEWDRHGAVVEPRTPNGLWRPDDAADRGGDLDATHPADRRELVRWIVHPENPLTSRVIVNQVWQLLFGQGLVRTPGDFGIQGERPVHQEVLDWLSVEFVASGWDLRHLLRTIVTSETYRQSSETTAAQRRRDPDNRWLTRGARFRLPSWMIRDGALAISGLLDRSLGGPPVFPHQPAGVWEEMFMGRMRYQPTVGRSRHRRSLYAFWRRNVAPTFFFDSADRRTCSVDRRQTNTPLQALTLLNDRTFIEAARALALRVRARHDAPAEQRITAMARRVLLRPLSDAERAALLRVHRAAVELYRSDASLTAAVVAAPDLDVVPTQPSGDPVELAALISVATVLFNLDEVLTRE